MRVSKIVLPVLAGTVLVGLAACGSGTSASGSTTTSQTTTASAPATTTQNQVADTPITSSTKAATAGVFTVDLTIQQSGLGLLAITNSGKTAASINGWPTLTFRNAANETVAVPVKKVNIPGAATPITLQPGRTAFAGVKWTNGDKASDSTFVATTLDVTAPGATKEVAANVIGTDGKKQGYYEFDITSVQVGTLQPSTEGVLVF
jgi:hypothetical protein